MPTDLEIAQAAQAKRIQEIAEKAGIPEGAISPYGQYIAKVDPMQLGVGSAMRAKLILVTAINPTPAGEGKTTVSVGLVDGMTKIGKKAMLALREPSLGPVFGMKGGAAGGGRAQVLPMEQINLHFTGDLHAITAANNLLAAMVDNHIQQGNALGIDPRQVTWRRCLPFSLPLKRNHLHSSLHHKVCGRMRKKNAPDGISAEKNCRKIPEKSGNPLTKTRKATMIIHVCFASK